MHKYPLWKYWLIAIIILLGFVYALPNLYGEDPAVQISAHSGVALDQPLEQRFSTVLTEHGIRSKIVEKETKTSLLIRFFSVQDQLKAQDLLNATFGENFTVALNLAPSTPAWLSSIGAKPMKLGLDLRGGVHFLLAIDIDTLLDKRVSGDIRNLRDEFRTEKIRGATIAAQKDHRIVIRLRSQEDLSKAVKVVKTRFSDYEIVHNYNKKDLRLSLMMKPAAIQNAENYAVEQTTMILRNRINELGISEPIVQRQGVDRISVDLPGIQDTARAKQILGGTATVEMHLVDIDNDPIVAAETKKIPINTQLYFHEKRPVLLQKRVILSGDSITGAVGSVDQYGMPAVQIRLGGGGESQFYRTTKQNIGNPMAITYVETKLIPKVVNGKMEFEQNKQEKIISVATIKSALGNNFQISGLHDSQEAINLGLLLRSGALPAPISIIEESTVGPSLGEVNIDKGILSVEIGFALIVIFMFIYYRTFGLAADIALLMNLILLVAILSVLNATLTLPGFAAIVLTLGMAVDANVLIFERIREELRNGMSPQASINAGFERALSTIIDSNLTTLIAAIALFALGSGAIKGFAVTLTIGLITSMFSAIMGTRAIIGLIYDGRRVKKLSIGI